MNNNALIIIAKYPEEGKVKTRIRNLTDRQRVELYNALLHLTIEKLASISGIDTFIAFAPESAKDYFVNFRCKLIPLGKGNLGVRMNEAFQHVFAEGYEKVLLVGADIPDISSPIILKAMDILTDHDLVFGPARDGGYYLIGMKMLIQEVFENVPWSSQQTLQRSLDQSKKYSYSFGFTDTLYDIDTIEDVKKSGLFQSLFT